MSCPAKVITVVNGIWKQNCYLVTNMNNQLLIIDPGSNVEEIIDQIIKLDSKPIAVLNTHAHYDHIGAVSALLENYNIPFFLHKDDEKLMKQANLYKILFETKRAVRIPSFDKDLAQNSEFLIGEFVVDVIHTPGHTRGSVCLLIEKKLFGGDTLMSNGPGRTDLPGGNKVQLEASLNKLRQLPSDYIVYPGHGQPFALKTFWSSNIE